MVFFFFFKFWQSSLCSFFMFFVKMTMLCFKFLNDRKDTCQAQFVKYNKKLNYKRYGWNRKKKLKRYNRYISSHFTFLGSRCSNRRTRIFLFHNLLCLLKLFEFRFDVFELSGKIDVFRFLVICCWIWRI